MSLYPIEVPAQDLYAASTTQRHDLGTRAIFKTAKGIVEAMYVRNANAASLPSGSCCHIVGTQGYVDTAKYSAVSAAGGNLWAGILCASLASSAHGTVDYAWVAYAGPVTALRLAATATSSDYNGALFSFNSLNSLVSIAATAATSDSLSRGAIKGVGGGATANPVATSGGVGFHINLWR